jgi:TonB family protein
LKDLLGGLIGGSNSKSPRRCNANEPSDKPNIRSDFELSLPDVYFTIGGFFSGHKDISVVKTTKGVIATYVNETGGIIREFSEAKLDTAEWQNFLNVLHKSISEWEKRCNSKALDGTQWGLKISFPDKKDSLEFFGSNAYPSNWNEFMGIINSIKAKMITKIDPSLMQENFRSNQEIRGTINAGMPGLRNVYNKYLKQRPNFTGSMIIKLNITPSGKVTNVDILSSTTDYPDFDNAIKNAIANWKYKAIEGGNSTVAVSLRFRE